MLLIRAFVVLGVPFIVVSTADWDVTTVVEVLESVEAWSSKTATGVEGSLAKTLVKKFSIPCTTHSVSADLRTTGAELAK
jgi:hypothetical protein